MRILHLNSHESIGGAAVAARRLHLGLLGAGADSHLAVAVREDDTPNTQLVGGAFSRRIARPLTALLEQRLPAVCHARPEHPAYTTFSFLPSLQHTRINALSRDILHLHWVAEGFLSPWALGRLRGPAIWTMHDTWPFTGGCHWLNGCEQYRRSCGQCPELCSTRPGDLSRWHWKLKRTAVQRLKPVLVSPSSAYADHARQSGMLAGCHIVHIPNGIDTSLFRPLAKEVARDLLGLPQDRPLVLFGAMGATSDHNKGFDLLSPALGHVRAEGMEAVQCVVFGASSGATDALPYPVCFLGRLHDDISLALAYSAADIFVCPSRQESFSLTTLESLACGTPVVAFATGGIPDMVEHGVTGYLAAPYVPRDLARGIALLLGDTALRQRMGEAGREKVEQQFALSLVVGRYMALYEEIRQEHAARAAGRRQA